MFQLQQREKKWLSFEIKTCSGTLTPLYMWKWFHLVLTSVSPIIHVRTLLNYPAPLLTVISLQSLHQNEPAWSWQFWLHSWHDISPLLPYSSTGGGHFTWCFLCLYPKRTTLFSFVSMSLLTYIGQLKFGSWMSVTTKTKQKKNSLNRTGRKLWVSDLIGTIHFMQNSHCNWQRKGVLVSLVCEVLQTHISGL